MLKPARALALACLAFTTCVASAQDKTGAWIATMVDASALPRMNGAQELFAQRATTSLVVRETIAEAAQATQALLAAEGWQQYEAPDSAPPGDRDLAIMSFKKGGQGLNVFISKAPAQGGATAIQYTPVAIAHDLPFPPDASEIRYAPDKPTLGLFTAASFAQTLAFYRTALGASGWSEWVPRDPRQVQTDPAGPRVMLYFTRESRSPLVLLLQRHHERTMVTVQGMRPDIWAAIENSRPDSTPAPPAAAPAPVASASAAHQPQPAAPAIETAAKAKPVRAPQTPQDVRELPRPAGAWIKDEDARKNDQHSMRYAMPLSLADAQSSLTRLLAHDGWVPFVEPLAREDGRSRYFKKGEQRISLHFHFDGENNSRSGVWITSTRNWNDIPTPPGTTDVVFDDRRPLLDAIAPGTVDELVAFFRTKLAARGWSEWSAADTARHPNARLETTIEGGVRATFTREARDRQAPIQVSLGQRADGRVDIEVRVPAFARPQQLKAEWKNYGLPVPELIKSASGRGGQTSRHVQAVIPAELDVVLAFYRRELATRDWKEDARGAVVTGDVTTLGFSSPNDGTLVLKLSTHYDLTVAELTQQLSPANIAARAKAKRETEEKAARDFEARMQASASHPAQAAADAPLPVPEGATAVTFDAVSGELKFDSAQDVPAVAGFYRANLKTLGWQERPSAIMRPEIVSLDLTRGGKRLYVSIIQMGSRTHVRAYGPALIAAAAEVTAARAAAAPAKAEAPLVAEDFDGFPVPESSTSKHGSSSKFRSEVTAKVRSDLGTVLAFYRRELAKLSWKEEAGASVGQDRSVIAYASPNGPASLTLGRDGGMTTISLGWRNAEEARKAGILPKPGTARVIMGNMIDRQAVVTLNNRTITLGAGVGKDAPTGPSLDLPPGRYRYTLKVPGRPASAEDVTVRADQTWALVVGPGGALALNLY